MKTLPMRMRAILGPVFVHVDGCVSVRVHVRDRRCVRASELWESGRNLIWCVRAKERQALCCSEPDALEMVGVLLCQHK